MDGQIFNLVGINRLWNMVPEEDFIKPNSHISWTANSLLYCETDNKEFYELSKLGSIVVRNNLLGNGLWKWKPEFEDLELTKFVKNLPFTNIIHVRILCADVGQMVAIHRDNKRSNFAKDTLSKEGYITITLNVSTGGQPLFFSLVSNESKPITTTAPAFIFNDYNFHGVPYVKERRRQVRITGKPTDEFFKLLKMDTLLYN